MEREQVKQEFSEAFTAWKEGDPSATDRLNKAINSAFKEGTDLVLKIPESALDDTAETRPMLKQDVAEYSAGIEDGNVLFIIPSESGQEKIERNKRLKIAAKDYRSHPSLILSNSVIGLFGVFYPREVTSLEPR